MNRRDFLASAALAGAASLSSIAAAVTKNETNREYYELRLYQMLLGSKKQILNDFLLEAAIPAWNRLGIKPVGVFNVLYGPNQPTLYVLLPHKSLESVATASTRLMEDVEYQKAGAAFLNVPLSDPAYVRAESSLMMAFSQMPQLMPPSTGEKKLSLFELRIYESHGEKTAKKKIEMFNEGGEIEIFHKTGLQPVFFGETLIGPRMPNLTYMLAFEDMAARDKAWDNFRNSPDWKTLSANPIYADTVSNITDIFLRSTPYSQI